MSVASASGQLDELHVEGTSYAPVGQIKTVDGKVLENLPVSSSILRDVALVCSLCNDARITYDEVRENLRFLDIASISNYLEMITGE